MLAYALAGGAGAALAGPWLVLVLLGCGTIELARRRLRARASGMLGAISALGELARSPSRLAFARGWPAVLAAGDAHTTRLVWTALKVGGLAFGGGFVIVPLMEPDATGAGG